MTKNSKQVVLEKISRYIKDFNDPKPQVAARAEHLLIRHYASRAVEPLIKACAHPNPTVRFRAVYVLAYSKDPKAYKTILKLTRDSDPGVSYDAVMALGVLGDARAIPPLIALLKKPSPASLDSAAAMALSRLGKPARPALLALLSRGPKYGRQYAASVLGGIGGPAAVKALGEALADKDEDLAIAALESLREIGTARCLALLKNYRNHPSEKVRETAAYWLNSATKYPKSVKS
jgi:HEAT repeat protein